MRLQATVSDCSYESLTFERNASFDCTRLLDSGPFRPINTLTQSLWRLVLFDSFVVDEDQHRDTGLPATLSRNRTCTKRTWTGFLVHVALACCASWELNVASLALQAEEPEGSGVVQ